MSVPTPEPAEYLRMVEKSNPSSALESEPPLADGDRNGLSKLDLFAAAAMHSLLLADKGISTDRLAIDAYNIAEAMTARGDMLAQARPSSSLATQSSAGAARTSQFAI